MALSRNTKIGILLTLVILFISSSFYFYQVFFASNFLVKAEKPAWLYIPKGATFQTVKDSLEKNNLVHDFLPFAFASRLMGYQDKIKPGAYEIQPNEANRQVIQRLRSGSQTPIKLTFSSYRTADQLAVKIAERLEMDTSGVMGIIRNPILKTRYGLDAANSISLFIPDSYEVYWTIGPDALMDQMGKAYQKFWNETRKAKARQAGISEAQVMTLASIVQSESNKVDEMPRIAGVYLNRLKKDMLLQADPTVVYAVGDFSIRRVLGVHLEKDSPYNTYKYKGLPPGPIAIAIRPAIDAVLNAEQHDFLYFCAREDFSGYHNFAKDMAGHMKNARTYQNALNKAGIH